VPGVKPPEGVEEEPLGLLCAFSLQGYDGASASLGWRSSQSVVWVRSGGYDSLERGPERELALSEESSFFCYQVFFLCLWSSSTSDLS